MDWQRRSGKSKLDRFGQFLVKTTLDVMDVASATLGYSDSSRELISGKIMDKVEDDLGTKFYEELCNRPTILKNIHYCQSDMTSIAKSHKLLRTETLHTSNPTTSAYAERPPSILNHDYLVLEMGYGADMGETMYIRAEKTKFEEGDAGIIIAVDLDFERTEGQALLITIQCLDKRIGLRALQDILGEHNPDYTLRDQNCWKYARWTARRLLQECRQDRSNLSREEHRMLQVEEETMESRIARSHVRRMGHCVYKGLNRLWHSFHNSTD